MDTTSGKKFNTLARIRKDHLSLQRQCLAYFNKLSVEKVALRNLLLIRDSTTSQQIYESRYGRRFARVCLVVLSATITSIKGIICCYHIGQKVFLIGSYDCLRNKNIENESQWKVIISRTKLIKRIFREEISLNAPENSDWFISHISCKVKRWLLKHMPNRVNAVIKIMDSNK